MFSIPVREAHAKLTAMAHSSISRVLLAQVLSKPEPSARKFGLLDCAHAFCLSCIRDWRSRTESGADVETVLLFTKP